MSAPAIPPDRPLRLVGDVHGDVRGFSAACATENFVIQLGDLVDYGPDSGATLRMAFELLDSGRGMFLLGNHEWKLARALNGRAVRMDDTLSRTIDQLDPDLRARAARDLPRTPAWLRRDGMVLAHGGFHTAMMDQLPPDEIEKVDGVLSRALYAEPTGRLQADGYPERSLRWVHRIPKGVTTYVGHDCRSRDGRPLTMRGQAGGTAVFLDTGAGKGGHLSWVDLPPHAHRLL